MRSPALTILMVLYGLFGAGFAGWTLAGRSAAPGTTLALPLPEPLMWTAATVDLALAIGIWRQVRATRWLALAVHALATAGAAVASALLARDGAGDAASWCELVAKFSVHAGLLAWWWRSPAVAAHFAPRPDARAAG